jgi:hypothetical protein|tara:strand:- start:260 stop:463 length:204 start_codon:yes stop_codon:yes gene_type:complete
MLVTTDIRKGIEEKRKSVINSLASGAASDYPEYQYLVGYSTGLQDAIEIAIDIVSKRLNIETEEDFK